MKNQIKISSSTSVLLDALRAGAALMVVIGHGISFFGLKYFMLPFFSQAVFPQILGVFILFFISGFLTFYSIQKKGGAENYSFRDFFIDRFSRICSAYYPALLFVIVVDLINISVNVGGGGTVWLLYSI